MRDPHVSNLKNRQLIEQFDGVAAMRNREFLLGVELRECTVCFGAVKKRIIAKSAVSREFVENIAICPTFKGNFYSLRFGKIACEGMVIF